MLQYFRAIVELMCHSKIFVYFCDTGDFNNINDLHELKILPAEYRVLPKLAITAKLFGIKPINEDWETGDSFQFDRNTSGKKFQAIVGKIVDKEKLVDDNSILEIRMIDVSKEYDECINDLFVTNGRAIPV